MPVIEVKGEVKTIACRQGSSGIFTGDIQGLYQGYRFGSSQPDQREFTLTAPHGELAVVLRQQIVTRLPPRSSLHPFADGQDPFDDYDSGRPLKFLEAPPAPGGEEPWPAPDNAYVSGPEEAEQIFKRLHYMDVRVQVVPEKSTGVFSGATGEIRVNVPEYRMPGYVIVNTGKGDLKMNFLERGSLDVLRIDLTVDGAASTGIYAGAEGELSAALTVRPPFFGRGPYEGTINLAVGR